MKDFKKIAITGGKGGTGKSTVAILKTNEFLRQGKKVVLADCDVECPNDYLLLGQKIEEKSKVYGEFPELIEEKCTKCGLCVKTCRESAIFQPRDKDGSPGHPVFLRDLCSGCGACWTVCPFGATKPKKEEIGKIYLNKIDNLFLVTGEARAGLEETGPVAEKTKEFAQNLAEEEEADIVLFDTAAGTHCPVINALIGVDQAYAVTEPTPMGRYDLSLILDLCGKLEVPVKVILNQSDLGEKKDIVDVVKKFNTNIEQEILYSKELVRAYSKGELLNYYG